MKINDIMILSATVLVGLIFIYWAVWVIGIHLHHWTSPMKF